jgi:hypothetical protein
MKEIRTHPVHSGLLYLAFDILFISQALSAAFARDQHQYTVVFITHLAHQVLSFAKKEYLFPNLF